MNGNDLYRDGIESEYYHFIRKKYPHASGIYLWTDPVGFQYVGKSDTSIIRRALTYIRSKKGMSHNIFLKRSIAYHGKNEMTCSCLESYSVNNANITESAELDAMRFIGSSFPNGFNLQPYGIDVYRYVCHQLLDNYGTNISKDELDDWIFRMFFIPEYIGELKWYIEKGLFDRQLLYRYKATYMPYLIV